MYEQLRICYSIYNHKSTDNHVFQHLSVDLWL